MTNEQPLENELIDFIKWFKTLSKKKKEFASILLIPNVDIPTLIRVKKLTELSDMFDGPIDFLQAYEESQGVKK